VGPRAGLDRYGISRPHRDSISGPSSTYPVAILTELPCPQETIYITKIFKHTGIKIAYPTNNSIQGDFSVGSDFAIKRGNRKEDLTPITTKQFQVSPSQINMSRLRESLHCQNRKKILQKM
jgi:hypothetical protein